MVIMAGVFPAIAAVKTPSLIVDGKPVAPAFPLLWDNGNVLISLEDLSTYINANFQWNEDGETTWVQKYGHTILFRISTGEVRKNSVPITPPVSARFIDETFYVPLRFVVENLGVTVIWDDKVFQVQITTGERHIPPERVSNKAFNAIVAFTDKGKLWLLDGREANSLPKQITDSGYAELVGWSQDGKWLAYNYYAKSQDTHAFLWVVGADGSGNRPVDVQPIFDDPVWSPTENKLAYTIWQSNNEGYVPAGTVKCANITMEKIQVDTLVEEDPIIIPSLAWSPDGESLTVSFSRTKDHPPMLEQVDLTGNRQVLYTLKDEEPVDPEGLYIWAFISLKWSPDGKHLAHHLRMNSGSLTSDVVATGLLDVADKKVISLNEGLKYQQWLAFSPDSEKLAYIAGAGREVILNKQLELACLADGHINYHSEKSYVDAQPVWLPGKPNELLFCRGPEAQTVVDSDIFPGVMVPGQRIYKLNENGKVEAITEGTADTADYYPSPSSSGEEMFFLRLERFNQGSLYLQPINSPENAVQILRGLRGSPGYYGNYYPQWIKVHWF
jgi:Tol biopolymer transport system component